MVNGYPLQYSCLENPMDRGVWRATVHGVTKSQIWLRDSTTTTELGVPPLPIPPQALSFQFWYTFINSPFSLQLPKQSFLPLFPISAHLIPSCPIFVPFHAKSQWKNSEFHVRMSCYCSASENLCNFLAWGPLILYLSQGLKDSLWCQSDAVKARENNTAGVFVYKVL